MAIDLERVRTALNSNAYTVEQKLILQWKWRGVLPELDPFRRALWNALEIASDAQLAEAARGYPDEVRAIRLFRTTWIGKQLADEGLLAARHLRKIAV